ncbi:PREDICTED: C-type lectin domain family 4 member G isoform X2 [Hipposideros armiger]|uniref:C-type lectin domain family 4 member G isoform X2 n=1 Tax=Hipposideros armiger TaxID=186990 RepID=A0A8B7TDK7_HIPAR|nr:PREDICTED: C-type lectin domain family 4 member G isoform X2 [Hipposideros armiger]
MDTAGYSKWDGRLEEVLRGYRGHWGRRLLFLALALVVTTVLWAFILSILLSKASTQRGALLDSQNLLKTNGLKTQAQLQTARTELGEAQGKLLEHQSALKDLSEHVTQRLAEAGRDRESIRSELFRALEAARFGNSSCEQCPTSWLPFQGSCYHFSVPRARWEEAQLNCSAAGAHLVIVGGLEEQTFLARNAGTRGYWLGLRAVRRARKIQGYQWVDGAPLSFSHWNLGEPNDSRGLEDCIMMLHTGLWNDAPCNSIRDNWICEKRFSC